MKLTHAGAYAISRIMVRNPNGQTIEYNNDARVVIRILSLTSEPIRVQTVLKLIRDGALTPIRDGAYLALTRAAYDSFWHTDAGTSYLQWWSHQPPYRLERTDLSACPDIENAI